MTRFVGVKLSKVYRWVPVDLIENRIEEKSPLPVKATPFSAAYDIHYIGPETTIESGATYVASTGISLDLPSDLCALVLPRSGLAAKHGITLLNAPGLIDPDYRGEIKVILHNHGKNSFRLEYKMRIAQLLFVRFEEADFVELEELSSTERGEKGLGSTGLSSKK